MKVKLEKLAVTKGRLHVGLKLDYGNAIRFAHVVIPVEDLVATDLYGELGKAAQRLADAEYAAWEAQQDALFD